MFHLLISNHLLSILEFFSVVCDLLIPSKLEEICFNSVSDILFLEFNKYFQVRVFFVFFSPVLAALINQMGEIERDSFAHSATEVIIINVSAHHLLSIICNFDSFI